MQIPHSVPCRWNVKAKILKLKCQGRRLKNDWWQTELLADSDSFTDVITVIIMRVNHKLIVLERML